MPSHWLHSFFKNYVYAHVSVVGYVHMSAGPNGGQKKVLEPLELELQAVVRYLECWEPNSGPLQEQYTLLPVELTLQLRANMFFEGLEPPMPYPLFPTALYPARSISEYYSFVGTKAMHTCHKEHWQLMPKNL